MSIFVNLGSLLASVVFGTAPVLHVVIGGVATLIGAGVWFAGDVRTRLEESDEIEQAVVESRGI